MAVFTPGMAKAEVVLTFPHGASGVKQAIEVANEMDFKVETAENGDFQVTIKAESVRKVQELSESFLSKATQFVD